MAVQEVNKDAEVSQRVMKLQTTQEIIKAALKEQERKNTELIASLRIVEWELDDACKKTMRSQASMAALLLQEAGSARKLQAAAVLAYL
ncbi:hypothetical protein R1flu_020205 [Riccia fluitans]|uniref:Uncharacterized protein n=1 Tax=Riccia fluitans TaxID=41844 RepID=A0ABD1ZLB1_9MARC